ncbi:hypothetical protein F4821DRAFT_229020 [Hypoxylon rubiginosum]|uniref:Uncharacterized protein n=1 Tax=Hypoxylon rubiginosum TaxID=110542 RepID=A0ACC0DCC6_9PEZI|nr:hypothetical protein F4821DRAFT_229020 [Hypoxylon rubiginosum]
MASQVALNLQYDFNYKEFKIQFSTSKQAVDYQQTNHEARILDDEDTVAWIPSPKGLKNFTGKKNCRYPMGLRETQGINYTSSRVVHSRVTGAIQWRVVPRVSSPKDTSGSTIPPP